MLVCPLCQRKFRPYGDGPRLCPMDKSELIPTGEGEGDGHAASSPAGRRSADRRIDTMVGNYQIKELLGRGGMGAVYRAEHILIGKSVAIKVLHEHFAGERELVGRFLREACAVARIGHPNIVDVLDFGHLPDGSTYLMMEYVEGTLLSEMLEREGAMPLHRAIPIVQQLAGALGAVHRQQIVHRDIKPRNVLVERRPGQRQLVRIAEEDEEPQLEISTEEWYDFPRLCDFGAAKMLDVETRALTRMGTTIGTPEYMAPEALQGAPPDSRADIYSLGVLFYELLTGRVPFYADNVPDLLRKVLTAAAPPLALANPHAEYTEAAERLIARSLAKEPANRPQSMDGFAAGLLQCYGPVTYKRTLREPPPELSSTASPSPFDGLTVSLEIEVDALLKEIGTTAPAPPATRSPAPPPVPGPAAARLPPPEAEAAPPAAAVEGASRAVSGVASGAASSAASGAAPAVPARPRGSFRSLLHRLKQRMRSTRPPDGG